jgi:hypothetical protein
MVLLKIGALISHFFTAEGMPYMRGTTAMTNFTLPSVKN